MQAAENSLLEVGWLPSAPNTVAGNLQQPQGSLKTIIGPNTSHKVKGIEHQSLKVVRIAE